MYTFTNQFSQSNLGVRVGMMHQSRSGWFVGVRYGVVLLLTFALAMACQHWNDRVQSRYLAVRGKQVYWVVTPSMADSSLAQLSKALRLHNIEFAPAVVRSVAGQLMRMQGTTALLKPPGSFPETHGIAVGDRFRPGVIPAVGYWFDPQTGFHSDLVTSDFPRQLQQTAETESPKKLIIYPATVEKLIALSQTKPMPMPPANPEDVRRLRVFDAAERERTEIALQPMKIDLAKRIHKAKNLPAKYRNKDPFNLMQELAELPSGYSRLLDMNSLLEVSFFKREEFMLHLTKTNHLDLYPRFRQAHITIDGQSATLAQLRAVHIREVKRAEVVQRSEYSRVMAGDDYTIQYEIILKRAPNRLTRDSSYYVFSPFYSGSF